MCVRVFPDGRVDHAHITSPLGLHKDGSRFYQFNNVPEGISPEEARAGLEGIELPTDEWILDYPKGAGA